MSQVEINYLEGLKCKFAKKINLFSEYILISDNNPAIMNSRRKKFLPTDPNLL